MSEIIISRAGFSDRAFIRSVSERTWPSTYGHIISHEQIDFMLEWMYSDTSLANQMETGCEFYIASIQDENGQFNPVGFCSVSPEQEEEEKEKEMEAKEEEKKKNSKAFKLNKLYVLPAAQGSGAGKALLNKAIQVAKEAGAASLFLQVNKQNTAYTFYLKNGFIKEADFKFDIGNGFYMDDYVMRLHF